MDTKQQNQMMENLMMKIEAQMKIDERVLLIHSIMETYEIPIEEIFAQSNEIYVWKDYIDNLLYDEYIDPYEVSKVIRYIAEKYPREFIETTEFYLDSKYHPPIWQYEDTARADVNEELFMLD